MFIKHLIPANQKKIVRAIFNKILIYLKYQHSKIVQYFRLTDFDQNLIVALLQNI